MEHLPSKLPQSFWPMYPMAKPPVHLNCLELATDAHTLATPLGTQGITIALHVFWRDRGQTQHGPATVP